MSKRSNACAISEDTRRVVGHRDNWTCIHCGGMHGRGIPNSHYIKRSQGGLGVERNVVTHCNHCHHEYDHGKNPEPYRRRMKEHLSHCYDHWDEDKLYYKKNGANDGIH